MASFVRRLARARLPERACNQYAESAIRRANLRLYLREIAALGPTVLLVGEAPSYRGGRLTGIAFTSEAIMLRGVGGFLGAARGYRKATSGPAMSTEASATMVWSVIRNIEPLPLLWNAFPFHPFRPGNPFSNRVPTSDELRIGAPFLDAIRHLFPIAHVVAVGRLAAHSLTELGVDHLPVRHPSQGGKQKFLAGMARLSQMRTA